MEADVAAFYDPDEQKADLIDGTIGEVSMFHVCVQRAANQELCVFFKRLGGWVPQRTVLLPHPETVVYPAGVSAFGTTTAECRVIIRFDHRTCMPPGPLPYSLSIRVASWTSRCRLSRSFGGCPCSISRYLPIAAAVGWRSRSNSAG